MKVCIIGGGISGVITAIKASINNDVTIKTVLSKMIKDLQYICDNIKQCDSI